jgi:hypothetical protein
MRSDKTCLTGLISPLFPGGSKGMSFWPRVSTLEGALVQLEHYTNLPGAEALLADVSSAPTWGDNDTSNVYWHPAWVAL